MTRRCRANVASTGGKSGTGIPPAKTSRMTLSENSLNFFSAADCDRAAAKVNCDSVAGSGPLGRELGAAVAPGLPCGASVIIGGANAIGGDGVAVGAPIATKLPGAEAPEPRTESFADCGRAM